MTSVDLLAYAWKTACVGTANLLIADFVGEGSGGGLGGQVV